MYSFLPKVVKKKKYNYSVEGKADPFVVLWSVALAFLYVANFDKL